MWVLLFFVIVVWGLFNKVRSTFKNNLAGKRILITGCDTGFGNSLAKKLDHAGAIVFASCLTEEGAEKLNEETSANLVTFLLDVTDEDSVKDAFQFVSEKCDDLYAVVNNAGIVGGFFTEITSMAMIKKVIDVNLIGTICVSKYFLAMLRAGKGRVINISSIAGRLPLDGQVAYTTSKFAVEGFSDTLRHEMAPHGVKVVLIEPTFMNTPILASGISQMQRTAENTSEELAQVYQYQMDSVLNADMKAISYDASIAVDTIYSSLEETYPKTRYAVGNQAKYLLIPFSFLPAGLSDLVFIYILPKLSKRT